MSLRKPIPFCSFSGYRPFTFYWWNRLLCYLTGITFYGARGLSMGRPGWFVDIYTYWHRARYGWAPRDTWSLNCYLNSTLAGTLEYLADYSLGCPSDYVDGTNSNDECHKWTADLRRWAQAFSEDPDEDSNAVSIHDSSKNYTEHLTEEERRHANIHAALKELEPVWQTLWD